MKINTQIALALGGAAASLSASAALLDSFDTYIPNPGINLSSTGALVRDNGGFGEGIGGDSSFSLIQRRASIQRTAGSDAATLKNQATGGFLNWGNNPQVQSTAVLRYDFNTPQDFASQNISLIDFLLANRQDDVSFKIDVFSVSFAGNTPIDYATTPYISASYLDAFWNPSGSGAFTKSFSVNSGAFSGANGGNFGSIWSSARMIVFTFSQPLNVSDRDLSIDSIELNVPQEVPEAKTLIPIVSLTCGLGFAAWRRRIAK